MAPPVPSLAELRAQAAWAGVDPTDEDLERVRGFLAGVLPAFAELDELPSPGTSPAAVFRPEEEP